MAGWSVYTLIYIYCRMNMSVSISSILVSQAGKRTGFFRCRSFPVSLVSHQILSVFLCLHGCAICAV